MGKQTEAAANTRQNLIDAFWCLYCQKRIEKITIREITAKAGYNRGTFYEYFNDVYQLLEELENSLIPCIDKLPQFTSAQTGTIGLPMGALFDYYEENSQYYSVLLGENGDPGFAAKLKKSIKPMLREVMPKELQCKLETDYALEYILSAMVGIMSYWYQNDRNIAKEKLIKLIRKINEKGIADCF